MKELDRIRGRVAAASETLLSRRTVLAGFAGFAASELASRMVVDPLAEQRETPAVRHITELQLSEIALEGSPLQQAAFEHWRAGSNGMTPGIMNRTTITEVRDDNRLWVVDQGEEIAEITWGSGFRPQNIPMDAQPDPRFGAWAEARMAVSILRRQPRFDHVYSVVQGADGLPRTLSYTSLIVPDGSTAKSITASVRKPEKVRPVLMSNQATDAGHTVDRL